MKALPVFTVCSVNAKEYKKTHCKFKIMGYYKHARKLGKFVLAATDEIKKGKD